MEKINYSLLAAISNLKSNNKIAIFFLPRFFEQNILVRVNINIKYHF